MIGSFSELFVYSKTWKGDNFVGLCWYQSNLPGAEEIWDIFFTALKPKFKEETKTKTSTKTP